MEFMIEKSNILSLMKKLSNTKIIKVEEEKLKIQIIKGSDKIVSIPFELSSDLSYVIAAMICDGHIKKDKYRIIFENVDKDIVMKFMQKVCNVFEIETKYRTMIDKRVGRKIRYRVNINSKPITVFLNELFEIPRGKKSERVKVPEIIKKSEKDIKKAFIEGVFDTDGGKRQHGFGLSSVSKKFRDDIVSLLSEFSINVHVDEWVNKKYNKKYYGLYFKPTQSGGTQVVKGARYKIL